MVLALSISLSACGGNKPISSNNSDEYKTEESEQEIIDSETENIELNVQPENETTENVAEKYDTLTEQTEDDTKDNSVQGDEPEPDNTPVNWGTPDGPETAVKNYYADTVFELVSFEIAQSSKEHVIFTIVSKKDGILVEPNRSIELRYEDGTWKVINEGY